MKPQAESVLITPAPIEEKTCRGIIIPDSTKEKPLQGEIIEVVNRTKREEMIGKPGDQILIGKYSGTELELEGEKYLIMRQNEIFAII